MRSSLFMWNCVLINDFSFLSPQMESTSLVTAEIQIECIRESMPFVKMKLKEVVTAERTMFDPYFFKFADTGR